MRNSGLTKSEQPSTGVSAMCERNFQLATEPLFQAGEVDVLEWSFDTAWGMPVSDWLTTQLQDFSTRGNLLGHGVSFSPFSGRWSTRQDAWLQHLGIELDRNPMRWVPEHFGFMDAGDFHQSSPLPVPLNEETLLVGQNRLSQLASVSSGPVGLENLAFAFSAQAMWQQGEFLDQLLAPVGGFLLLDLHNVYCQAWNFDCRASELLDSFPLDRVRELHISGGSWDETSSPGNRLRRDTHDGAVPEEVFELLTETLDRCPQTEVVILEQIGAAFDTQSARAQFRKDYERMREIVVSRRASGPETVA
jgi:uncharacterized protein (UPF0276 family)